MINICVLEISGVVDCSVDELDDVVSFTIETKLSVDIFVVEDALEVVINVEEILLVTDKGDVNEDGRKLVFSSVYTDGDVV